MKTKSLGNILFVFFFVLTFALIFMFSDANATKPKPPKPQPQTQGQQQNQNQTAQGGNAEAHGGFGEGGDSYSDVRVETGDVTVDASSGDLTTEQSASQSVNFESNHQSGPADVVLVPNNNTASCQRVYGFGGGNRTGNAVFGIPYRDKQCDLEAAADDAFAQGNLALGWVWKCKQKNLKRQFGGKNWRTEGEELCLQQVASIASMNERIRVLEGQKATLLDLRKVESAQCDESKSRILEGCARK